MSHLIFSRRRDPRVGSNAKEGMDLLTRHGQADRQTAKASYSRVLTLASSRRHAQIRVSQHKRSGLKACLPTSDIWIRSRSFYFKLSKIPSQVFPVLGGLGLIPYVVKLTTKSSYPQRPSSSVWVLESQPDMTGSLPLLRTPHLQGIPSRSQHTSLGERLAGKAVEAAAGPGQPHR